MANRTGPSKEFWTEDEHGSSLEKLHALTSPVGRAVMDAWKEAVENKIITAKEGDIAVVMQAIVDAYLHEKSLMTSDQKVIIEGDMIGYSAQHGKGLVNSVIAAVGNTSISFDGGEKLRLPGTTTVTFTLPSGGVAQLDNGNELSPDEEQEEEPEVEPDVDEMT